MFFSWLRVLRNKISRSIKTIRRHNRSRPDFRLLIEALEDRTAPATFQWVAGSTSWNAAASWTLTSGTSSLNYPAVAGDIAQFTGSYSAAQAVSITSAVVVGEIDFGATTSAVTVAKGSGGSLTLQNSSGAAIINFLSSNAVANTISSTIANTSGGLNITDNETGATKQTLSGAITANSGLTITNVGTLTDSANISATGGITITNTSGTATFGGAITTGSTASTSLTAIVNGGNLVQNNNVATTTIGPLSTYTVNNGGVLSPGANATFADGQTNLGLGQITLNNGSKLQVNNANDPVQLANPIVLGPNASVTLAGAPFLFEGGSITLNGNNTITVSSSTPTAGLTPTQTTIGEAITGSAASNTLTVAGSGTAGPLALDKGFTFSGSNPITLTGNTLDLSGYTSSTGPTFTVNVPTTINNILSGTGSAQSLTVTGSSTLTLGGVNTYTGSTTVSSGTLSISADNNLGTAPSSATAGQLVLSGGTLQATASFVLSSNRGIALGPTSGSGSGTIDVTGANTLTYGGIIANNGGTGSLITTDTGTLSLTGSTNSYTGATTVNAGTLADGVANALPTGTALSVAGTFDLASFAQQVASVTGSGAVTDSGTTAAFTVNNTTPDTFSGSLTGTLALTKSAAGTLKLTGTNSYSGATAVNGGALVVDGSQPTSAVTVNSGVVLGGTGTTGAQTVASGTVNPGDPVSAVGALKTNSANLSSGGNLTINVTGSAGSITADALSLTSILTLGGTSALTLDLTGLTATPNSPITIVTAAGGVSGTFTDTSLAGGLNLLNPANIINSTIAGVQASVAYIGNTVQISIWGAASKLAFTVPPTSTLAGTPIGTVKAQIQDAFGNLVQSDSSDQVTVSIASGPGAFTGTSTTTVTAVNGVATFSNLQINTAGAYTLGEAGTSSLTGLASSSFTISPAAASKLVVTTQPSATAAAGGVFSTQPVVAEEDSFGNIITTDSTHTVTATSTGTAALQGTTTVTLSNGVATFSGLSYNKAETIALGLSTNAGSFTATSNNIAVSPAAASKLVVTTQPSATATAGVAFGTQPVVAEEDNFGNVITSDNTHTLTATSTGTATLQGTTTLTLSNGVANFSGLAYNKAETLALSLTTNAGAFTATSSNIVVSPAAASQFVITQQPSATATAGVVFSTQPVVEAEDSFGNVVTNDSAHTVTATSTGTAALEGTTTVTLVNGVATFSGLSYNKAETIALAISTNAGSFTTTTNNIAVSPAAASKLVVTTQPSATATAGVAFGMQPVVTEEDSFGNVITSDSTHTLTATSTGTATLQGTTTLTLSNGVATFSGLSYNKAETIALSFTTNAGAFTATSSTIVVNPTTASQFVITQQPSATATAGVAFGVQPVVEAEDSFGNVVTNDSAHTVTATSTGTAALQGTTTVTLSNGVATFSGLAYNKAETIALSFTTNAGAFTATSSNIAVNPAAASQLVVTQQPSATATAGVIFGTQPVVTEEDSFGNIITSDSTHTLTATSSGTAALQGTTTLTLSNGIATFSGLSYNKAETITLSFTTNAGAFTATSSNIAVSPAAASNLVVTTQPSATAIAGVAFGTQPVVAEEDSFGNVITNDSTHTLTATSMGTAALQGTTTLTLSNGVATFSGLAYNKAETIALSFTTNAGAFTAMSSNIVVSPAAASQFGIIQQPSATATAGVVFGAQPVVEAEDSFGNVVTNDSTHTVTATSTGTAALQGTTTVTLVNGVAAFAGLAYNKAETIALDFSSNAGAFTATSSNIAISPAAASKLVVTTQPSATATAGVAFGTQPVVAEEDSFGNVITSDSTHTVTATSTGTATLQGTTTLTLSNGVATFSGLSYNKAETIALDFTTNAGAFTATSGNIEVNPAAPSQFVITQQPSATATAGLAFGNQPVVAEEDNLGNVVTNDSTNTVSATSTGTAALQGTTTVTLVNGVGTFSGLSYNKAETIALSFTTNAGAITATSSNIVVSSAAASQLVITQQPSSTATAGVAFSTQPVVVEEDSFGNVITSDSTHTLTATSTGTAALQGTTTVTLVNGVATFSGVSYNKAETIALDFSTNAGSYTTTSNNIAVSPAAASRLVVTQQPSATAAAGVAFGTQPVVAEEDSFGNVITNDSTHTLTATSTGTAELQGPTIVTLVDGVGAFSGLSYNKAETIALNFTTNAGAFTATSGNIVVDPAAASQLVITQQPSSAATAGLAFGTQPVVAEEDSFGNVITSDSTHTLTATSTGTAALQGTTTLTLSSGVATFSGLSYNKAETITLSFTTNAGAFTATSSNVVVNPAVASQLVVTQVPSATATAGVVFGTQPVVTEEDSFGNVITSDNTHTLTAASTGTAALQGTTTLTLSNGVTTFSGLSYNKAETITLSFATNAGAFTATSSNIAVSPATASQLVVTQLPSATATAGVVFGTQPVVAEEDSFGNVITSDSTHSLTATSTGAAALQGTTTVTLSNGVATFSGLSYNKAETIALDFSTNAGSFTTTSGNIVVNPAAASQLVVTQQPSATATAGVAFGTQPVVAEEDSFGNVITSDSTHSLTATSTGTAALQGTTTVTLNNGVATFSGLSYNKAETIALDFTTNAGAFTATSSNIAVSPAAASQLVVTTQPSATATAGVVFGTQPVVTEEDSFGNVITSDSTHSLTATSTGTAALQGTTTVILADGVATFSGLSYDKAETIALDFSTNAGSFTTTSSNIVANPAAASQLVVTTQPSATAIAGVAFGTQPVVAEEDSFGNVITSDSTHSLTATSTGTAALQGTTTLTLTDGVATFSGLSYNKAETITLSFTTNAGAFTATSSNIVVSPAAASQFVITQQPLATATAGVAFGAQPVVEAEDSFGNVVTNDSTHTVTATSTGTAALQGTTTVTLVNGVATFSDLSYDKAETITLSFSTNAGSFTATSSNIVVSPAAASQLVVTEQPSATATAGVAFGTQPVVAEEDRFGNVITSDSTHSLAATSTGTAALQGTTTVALTNGVAIFSGLSYDKAETITLSFTTNAGVFTATSSNIVVNPAAASQLVVTTQPSATATAGVAFGTQPVVAEEDSFGNVITSDSTHSLTATSTGTAALQGTTTLTLSNGVATFSGLSYNKAETITLSFTTNAGAFTATSSDIVISPAAASQFLVSAPAKVTATTAFTFTVAAEDPFDNAVPSYAGTVHFTSSDSAAILPVNATLTDGTGSFSATLETTGYQTLTATDSVSSAITGTSGQIEVAGLATHFAVSVPANATAGTAFSFTVTALDGLNDTASNYTGVVHFTSGDPLANLPADVSLTNGVGSFTATLKTAGNETLTATSTVKPSVSGAANIDVSPLAATHFSVNVPPSATAGTPFTATVIAQDKYNNTATGFDDVVHLTSSDTHSVLPADTVLNNGVGSFSITLETAGNQTLTATDTVNSLINGTSGNVNVQAVTATHYLVSAPSNVTAGTAFTFTVTALDAFNNLVSGYNGIVQFTSSDSQSVLPGGAPLTNGVGTFSATLKTAGSQTLTATDAARSSIIGTADNISVSAAAVAHFAFSPVTGAITGTAFNFTLTAEDSFNNTVSGYTGTVHFTSSDTKAILPANATLTNGVGTFSVALKTVGPQTLTAADTAIAATTSTSDPINVTGTVNHFAFSAVGDVAAAEPSPLP